MTEVLSRAADTRPPGSAEWIALLTDSTDSTDGTDGFVECDSALGPLDPLGFTGYPDLLADAARETGGPDAARWGVGAVDGHQVVLCALDARFLGGTVGAVVGEKVARAAEFARLTRAPLVICSASAGPRVQEGVFALAQLAKTTAALARLSEAGVLFVSVLCGPVHESVTFAALGDVTISELPDPRADVVVGRDGLRAALAGVLAWDAAEPVDPPVGGCPAAHRPTGAGVCPVTGAGGSDGPLTAWDVVRLARADGRPGPHECLAGLDWFLPLSTEDSEIGGLALLAGSPVVVAGPLTARAARLAERFAVPLVAFAGDRVAPEVLALVSGLATPVVSIVVGESVADPGVLIADRLLMLENATLAVACPESCATSLLGEPGRAPEAASALRLTANQLLDAAVVDRVVPEPVGGAHTDRAATVAVVLAALAGELAALRGARVDELLESRYRKLRDLGPFTS